MKKIGVALSGGSALGIVHIGIMQAFRDDGLAVDCIAGTSAGSVVAACYAFGVPMEEVAKAARKINWFKLSRMSYSVTGLASNAVIGETMIALIGRDARIEDADIPLAIVAADISTGEKIVFRSGSVANAVMASTCIPGLFAPVSFENRLLVDGGLVENLPIAELPGMGAEITIGVNLERWRSYKRPRHAVGVLVNSMDIMVQHQSILHGAAASVIIEPHLEKYTSSAWDKADELIAEGGKAAQIALPGIRKLAGVRRARRGAKAANPAWYARPWRWLAKLFGNSRHVTLNSKGRSTR